MITDSFINLKDNEESIFTEVIFKNCTFSTIDKSVRFICCIFINCDFESCNFKSSVYNKFRDCYFSDCFNINKTNEIDKSN